MNRKKNRMFSGLIPPMVTPLDERRQLDAAGVKNMVGHLLKGGVDGIFLLGTTGEGPHLSYAVREKLVKETCRLVKGRVPVLVGITETDLEDALSFAKWHAFVNSRDPSRSGLSAADGNDIMRVLAKTES